MFAVLFIKDCRHGLRQFLLSYLYFFLQNYYSIPLVMPPVLVPVACRTGVIFCVNRGESEASASGARGEERSSPRVRLAFASVYAKNQACSAGYCASLFTLVKQKYGNGPQFRNGSTNERKNAKTH